MAQSAKSHFWTVRNRGVCCTFIICEYIGSFPRELQDVPLANPFEPKRAASLWSGARTVEWQALMGLPATVLMPSGRISSVANYRAMVAGFDDRHPSTPVASVFPANSDRPASVAFSADPQTATGNAPVVPRWLSTQAFLEQIYRALRFGALASLPDLLSGLQSRALWRSLITSAMPTAPAACIRAEQVLPRLRREFALAGLDPVTLPWSRSQGDPMLRVLLGRYSSALERMQAVDADGLALCLAERLVEMDGGGPPWPPLIVLVAPPTPVVGAILQAAMRAGTHILRFAPKTCAEPEYRVAGEFRAELRAAAAWAADRVAALAPAAQPASTALAVAGLSERQETVITTLRDVLGSEHEGLWGMLGANPLMAEGVVRDAMSGLEILRPTLCADGLRALLRAVHFDHAPAGTHHLAALADADWLNGHGALEANAVRRCLAESGAALLASRLAQVRAAAAVQPAAKSMATWSGVFAKTLDLFGWPGDETQLSERARRAVDAMQETVDALAALDVVLPAQTLDAALDWLNDAVSRHPGIRTPGPMPAIQIMDADDVVLPIWPSLWVLGLTAGTWPCERIMPPGLPRNVAFTLRAASHASDASVRMQEIWRGSDALVLSFAAHEGDEEHRPSTALSGLAHAVPLPVSVSVGGAAGPFSPSDADVNRAGVVEWVDEDMLSAPLGLATAPRGGSSVLEDQAQCPFRAFARHRLGVVSAEEARLGLAPHERGNLTHKVLERVFAYLPDHASLVAASVDQRREIIARAIDEALSALSLRDSEPLVVQMLSIEREALSRRVGAWLEIEAERVPFRVMARESDARVAVGPLNLNLRLDRVDALEDGRVVVIDYKTGECNINDWLRDRMRSVQLPLYAVTEERPVAAIFFGQIKGEAPKLLGLMDPELPLQHKMLKSSAGKVSDWDAMLDHWRTTLTGYAHEFAAGFARVAPDTRQTCERCGMFSLCRVRETPGALVLDDDTDD